ncbi:hypothetical protein [Brevundimonas sp.]|uniref:hypothetical protein n=1 Tax=Brevundimonas sp. TaxID=1871086 RepID=UPI00272FDEC8|nr:hypothetical protein [Brevundimonas sp.]MDP1913865.1 hypothetical protein [Brevundimonas sp.]
MLTILMLGGCAGSNPPIEAGNPPSETSGFFQPALFQQTVDCDFSGRKVSNHILDEFEDSWYSKHLRAAGERPLSFAPGSRETLRFTWLRSFHSPVIVRVEWAPTGAATLTATMLSGAGGYEPGEVSNTVSRTLTQVETERLLVLRQAILREPPVDCAIMLDGARWIVEAAGADGYHYVNAQSPQTGTVHDLGMALLGFTGWAVEPIY